MIKLSFVPVNLSLLCGPQRELPPSRKFREQQERLLDHSFTSKVEPQHLQSLQYTSPPDLDYFKYAILLGAEQQIKAENDFKKLGWREKAMNLMYEQLVLEDYNDWTLKQLSDSQKVREESSGDKGKTAYFKGLKEAIETDIPELEEEQQTFVRADGMSTAQMR